MLRLDPEDEDAEEMIKWEAEDDAAKELEAALAAQHAETMVMLGIPAGNVGADWMPPSIVVASPTSLAGQLPSAGMQATLSGVMMNASTLGVRTAADTLAGAEIGVNWQLANVLARDWAKSYSYSTVEDLNLTTAEWLGEKISKWIDDGKPLIDLRRELKAVWSEKRARTIAVTEVTRAFVHGSLAVYRGVPGIEQVSWRTAINDVCPVCRPMHGTRGNMAGVFEGGLSIPAHARCRCWVAPVVEKARVAALLPKPNGA